MKNYVVTIDEKYLRDTQVYMGKHKNIDIIYDNDKDWKDMFPIHFIGVFQAKNKKSVIQHVSKKTGFPWFILRAEDINFITQNISKDNDDNFLQMTIDNFL